MRYWKNRKFIIGMLSAAALTAFSAGSVLASQAGTAAETTETAAETAAEVLPAIVVKAKLTSCEITSDKQNISISGSYEGEMTGTDGNFYLFELQPFESGVGSRTDYFQTIAHGQSLSVQIPLNWSSSKDRIYNRFIVAVWDTEKRTYTEVSEPHYITNPELMAANQNAFPSSQTKKGLRMEVTLLDDAMELGVKHAGVDILFQQILGPGIEYNYNGKTYHFNKDVMADYDKTISAMSAKGIIITAVILNGWSDDVPALHYPGATRQAGTNHFMFNVETQEGYELTRATAAFLAERYNGSNHNHGTVNNWVIGNEINNQKVWNYAGPMELETYVDAYQKAFRVFYTAIKTTAANDRVYYSIDFHWNNPNEIDGKLQYAAKDVVDTFNAQVRRQGQMDWGLAYHPYSYPMSEPEFWDDPQSGLLNHTSESPIINFANLGVLTDYFTQDALRDSKGQVRHIILTEQGFSSTSHSRGDVPYIQAAAFAYSYYIVDSNPYIDSYLLSRQVDAPAEVRTGLTFGLWSCYMDQGDHIVAFQRRKIWQVFKHIDKQNTTLANSEFAKEIIGIEKWSDVVPNFKWSKQEN